ncbi:MAG: sigma 54-interacting transcriptional regulator [Desulfosarcina sp.]|nr:sigma 54-interacting transcriptional regulator [Desulfobacterales bacterium]
MKESLRLTPDEKTFFFHVYKAGLASSFSDDRIELEAKIADAVDLPIRKRIERAIHRVKASIAVLERGGRVDFNRYGGADRGLVRAGLLFDFFYDFRERFDQLIRAQIAAGDTPIKVAFADEALRLLRQRGFNPEDALRYFALCYQLRRAYFFLYRTLVGCSPGMKKLRQDLWHNVFTHNIELYDRYLWNRMEDFSTLLLGETGTGKGTAAMAIGRSGFIPFDADNNTFVESFTRSFVSLNLSQFPATLVESELFGHKKGAFTGAVKDHRGVFDHCSPYGAILLDEIGELSIPIQIKLLQVLQDRKFVPVGSHQEGRFEGRVIAATNRSLEEIHSQKVFRDDFYYRLCSDIITVPPLRQRIREDPGEMGDLLGFTVKRMVGMASPELVAMVREVIDSRLGADYPWPGNVRELEQCVRRVILKREYAGRPGNAASRSVAAHLAEGIENGSIDTHSLMTGYCYHLYDRFGTFEEVARRTRLDRRTVKKYIREWKAKRPEVDPSA